MNETHEEKQKFGFLSITNRLPLNLGLNKFAYKDRWKITN